MVKIEPVNRTTKNGGGQDDDDAAAAAASSQSLWQRLSSTLQSPRMLELAANTRRWTERGTLVVGRATWLVCTTMLVTVVPLRLAVDNELMGVGQGGPVATGGGFVDPGAAASS